MPYTTRADKTDRQTDSIHADRVLGDGSWTRGKRPKSTNVTRNKQAGVHGFELPARTCRVARMAAQYSCSLKAPRVWSPRALTSYRVEDGPQLISLTVQHTNPGLACPPDKVQVEVLGSGKRVEPLV